MSGGCEGKKTLNETKRGRDSSGINMGVTVRLSTFDHQGIECNVRFPGSIAQKHLDILETPGKCVLEVGDYSIVFSKKESETKSDGDDSESTESQSDGTDVDGISPCIDPCGDLNETVEKMKFCTQDDKENPIGREEKRKRKNDVVKGVKYVEKIEHQCTPLNAGDLSPDEINNWVLGFIDLISELRKHNPWANVEPKMADGEGKLLPFFHAISKTNDWGKLCIKSALPETLKSWMAYLSLLHSLHKRVIRLRINWILLKDHRVDLTFSAKVCSKLVLAVTMEGMKRAFPFKSFPPSLSSILVSSENLCRQIIEDTKKIIQCHEKEYE